MRRTQPLSLPLPPPPLTPPHRGAGITHTRRDFITFAAAAAAFAPLAARAQAPAMTVLGFLGTGSPEVYATRLRVFDGGLEEAGDVGCRKLRMNSAGQMDN